MPVPVVRRGTEGARGPGTRRHTTKDFRRVEILLSDTDDTEAQVTEKKARSETTTRVGPRKHETSKIKNETSPGPEGGSETQRRVERSGGRTVRAKGHERPGLRKDAGTPRSRTPHHTSLPLHLYVTHDTPDCPTPATPTAQPPARLPGPGHTYSTTPCCLIPVTLTEQPPGRLPGPDHTYRTTLGCPTPVTPTAQPPIRLPGPGHVYNTTPGCPTPVTPTGQVVPGPPPQARQNWLRPSYHGPRPRTDGASFPQGPASTPHPSGNTYDRRSGSGGARQTPRGTPRRVPPGRCTTSTLGQERRVVTKILL